MGTLDRLAIRFLQGVAFALQSDAGDMAHDPQAGPDSVLFGLLPTRWQRQAALSGACERLRGCSSASNLLRTLLLHVGNGHRPRETVVRAKAAGIAEVSDVALMKRLRNAEGRLHGLCVSLLEQSGWERPMEMRGYTARALDETLGKKPGRGGSLWRILGLCVSRQTTGGLGVCRNETQAAGCCIGFEAAPQPCFAAQNTNRRKESAIRRQVSQST